MQLKKVELVKAKQKEFDLNNVNIEKSSNCSKGENCNNMVQIYKFYTGLFL